jgi:short-subunit dehydrogenase
MNHRCAQIRNRRKAAKSYLCESVCICGSKLFVAPWLRCETEQATPLSKPSAAATLPATGPTVTIHRPMGRRLADMSVVITGASAGIGRALAEQLSAAGAVLTLAARRVDRLEALNAALGGRHRVVRADVSVRADCEALIAAAAVDGRTDTLVCNAGYGLAKPTAMTTADEVSALFQTNVFGTLDAIRPAVVLMRAQPERDGYRGQIMVVSSAVARRAVPYFGVYAATKAAQLSLCEALRVELAPSGIAVTSVHPAGTDTEFFDVAGQRGGTRVPGARRQSVAAVAAAMVAAIVRPRPEVWPRRLARLGTSFCTLVPGLTDRALRNYRAELSTIGPSETR